MKLLLRKTIVMLVVVGSVTACSQAGTQSGEGQQDENRSNAPKEPVEIVFYSTNNDSVEGFDQRLGTSLRKKFPDYTIKYIQSTKGNSMEELLASGTRFDIFYQTIGNYEGQVFPNRIEYDMSELIAKHKVDLNRFEPTVMDALKQTSNGKMYALPVITNNLLLYYNKDLFDKFGVPYPKDGMTWEQISELSKKLSRTDEGTQYFGFTHSPLHTIRMNQLSIPNADLKTNTPTINQDSRWSRFFQTLFLDPVQEPGYAQYLQSTGKIPGSNEFIKSKNVAMYVYIQGLMGAWGDQVNYDVVSLPVFSDRPGIGSQSYPSYYGITNMAKDKDAAMEVLKYIVSDEYQTELALRGDMTVLTDERVRKQLGQGTPYKDKNWQAAYYNKFAPFLPKGTYDAELVTIYGSMGIQLQTGKIDMNTGLRQAGEQAQKKIAEITQMNK
ncbi:ABC transporter substrate-binding protein [Paenibacillus sp. GCM10012303]|uniref:ABC transporter substrate-binding protein n=1 Tax=Paenibacillus sp. GCM10012303 TaxID=3317340 RepID=UPI00361BB7FD